MQVACRTSGISARRNVNLLTSVRRGLSYPWKMVRAKGGLCVANRAAAKLVRNRRLILSKPKLTFRRGYVMHSLPAEWLPVSIAPFDGDLEVCALDYDGIVHALVFPCHKDGAQWADASNKKHVDIQPTHWRKWTESY